jgi:prepilin-type processing-associated H-X9-DG protein
MALGVVGSAIGVIGVLSMVLLRLHAPAQRTECANNLRQIGQAVRMYDDFYRKGYPQATLNTDRGAALLVPWTREPYVKRLSWLVSIRPFLKSEDRVVQEGEKFIIQKGSLLDLYTPFQTDRPWDAPENEQGLDTFMRIYQCPAHPQFNPRRSRALGHYVGISGIGADAAELSLDSPYAGFFGYERRLTREEVVRGQSYTLLATETMVHNGPWAAGGPPTLRGLVPQQRPWIGQQRPFGGLHPDGANLLMVDGSVTFFSNRGSDRVLQEMATVSGEVVEEQ